MSQFLLQFFLNSTRQTYTQTYTYLLLSSHPVILILILILILIVILVLILILILTPKAKALLSPYHRPMIVLHTSEVHLVDFAGLVNPR